MAFFTKTEVRSASQRKLMKSLQKRTASQALNEAFAAAKDTDSFDIFLSHAIADAELVQGVKDILEEQGFRVYVDWDVDPQLDRRAVSKETAELLRKRMRQSKSLIYLATANATQSKWMPWELGYFDGHSKGNVAVMPLTDNENDKFPRQEYLGLYPLVQKGAYKNGTKDVFVEGAQWTTLKAFGTGAPVWKPYSTSP